jgi:hypothetical protein
LLAAGRAVVQGLDEVAWAARNLAEAKSADAIEPG